jgi:hypothetical protein
MAVSGLEPRVSQLEQVLTRFITEMAELNQRAEQRTARLEHEMGEFKDEMREFKDEMGEFKDEMGEFKDEMRQSRRELDKKWGDLANKLGTMAEDILAPNLRRLARDHFGFEVLDFGVRRERKANGKHAEYDVLVVGAQHVIMGEAKSTPRLEDVPRVREKVDAFLEFFPEYVGRRLITVFGSWAIPKSVVTALTQAGIYAMQMGEETMELVNAPALEAHSAG